MDKDEVINMIGGYCISQDSCGECGLYIDEKFYCNADNAVKDLPRVLEVIKGGRMIKDSGERTEFNTGAVRDMHNGKGDMVSMPWAALLRVSKQYEAGARKYGRFNYQKGIPVSSFIDSAMRHLAKYLRGMDDEDHLSAAAFNVLGAIQMEETNPSMLDLDSREGKECFHYDKGGEKG